MHRVGFLGRYLPEFGELTDLVQHEFFHRYTADEHTLKCLERLDELSDNKNPKLAFHQKLFHDLEDPFVLYAALLMHDTGRAEGVRKHADASTELADQVCRRLKRSELPFGGLQVILSGDFFQLPPVTKFGAPARQPAGSPPGLPQR